jgi:8-oxo-dGTP pyrophosphatase MutT (NUDIX family)
MKIVHHHSVGFVVYTLVNAKRQYLLLKYPEGHIDLVKGHIDSTDADLLATAARELEEETGLFEFKHIEGFFHEIYYEYIRDLETHQKKVDFFLAEVYSNEIKISHEHTEFIWCSFEEAMKCITFDNARSVVSAAEDFLSNL